MLPYVGVFLSCLLALSDCRRPPKMSDSILDIINTDEVERMIAQRRANASKEVRRYLETRNNLDNDEEEDGSWDYYDRPLYADSYVISLRDNQSTDDDATYRADKLLKSSKVALLVTKRDYLKKDWCKTEPLIQRIKEEGCVSRTIVNNFCYGQCNSFYIPKNPRRRRTYAHGELETSQAFKSCSFCKPKKSTTLIITLKCPSLTPPLRRKRVLRVKQCKCLTEG